MTDNTLPTVADNAAPDTDDVSIDIDQLARDLQFSAQLDARQLCFDIVEGKRDAATLTRIRQILFAISWTIEIFKRHVQNLRGRREGQKLLEKGKKLDAICDAYLPQVRALVAFHVGEAERFDTAAHNHRAAAEFLRHRLAARQGEALDAIGRAKKMLWQRRTRQYESTMREVSVVIRRLEDFCMRTRVPDRREEQTAELYRRVQALQAAFDQAQAKHHPRDAAEIREELDEALRELNAPDTTRAALDDAREQLAKLRAFQQQAGEVQQIWKEYDFDIDAKHIGSVLPPANLDQPWNEKVFFDRNNQPSFVGVEPGSQLDMLPNHI